MGSEIPSSTLLVDSVVRGFRDFSTSQASETWAPDKVLLTAVDSYTVRPPLSWRERHRTGEVGVRLTDCRLGRASKQVGHMDSSHA